jgi:hypothetical protein
MKVFVNIEKKYGIPAKGVIGSLCVLLITGIIAYFYNTAELPAQTKQINEIVKTVKQSDRRDSSRTIQFEMLKYDVNQIKIGQSDCIEAIKEVKKGQDKLIDYIITILRDKEGDGLTKLTDRHNEGIN